MPREPHPWLLDVADVPHGGAASQGLLDLSASIAPLGPSPAAVAAAVAAPVDRYPPRRAAELERVVAAELGAGEERIVTGPGAADLLLRVALAHLRPGDWAVLVAPCFGEYERAVRACGARPVTWTAREADGFRVDPVAVAALANATDAAVGFLARPANPTGVQVDVDDVHRLVAATPRTTWIVDEAFLDLCDDRRSVAGGDAVVVRSLTKDLALPGLRVAAVDAPPFVAQAIRALTPPWCVSAPAIAAAIAGLADTAHREATRAATAAGREALTSALRARGAHLTDACANYVCVQAGDDAAAWAALRRTGIQVRACTDLGLPGWIRVAVPHPRHVQAVVDALLTALHPVAR